jgi:hypothetical protein
MKNFIIYSVCTAILFLFGIGIMHKTSPIYHIINQYVTQNITPVSNITPVLDITSVPNIIPVPNIIKPQMDSLNEELANFPYYSAAEHKQLFNRTKYVNKQSNGFSEFASIIANAAGLDQSSQLEMNQKVMNSTVLILSANMGYADMTFNFLCRLAKISKTFKYVVIAQDTSFYDFLQSHKIPSISGSLIHPISTQNAEDFGTTGFKAISIAKMIAVRVVLELGYNVLFSDVDIAWKKNPVPFIPVDVDLAIQSNSGTNVFPLSAEPNTGFYFLRSNDRSMALLDDTIDRARKDPSIDDQTHFGNALRDWRISKKAIFIMEGMTAPWAYHGYRPFTFRLLRPYCFQSGQVASASYAQKVEPPQDGKEQNIILVHANYIVGHNSKVHSLKSYGLWNLNDQKFRPYLARWKSKGKTNKEQQNQGRQISYELAFTDSLAHVCVNLVG